MIIVCLIYRVYLFKHVTQILIGLIRSKIIKLIEISEFGLNRRAAFFYIDLS